MATFAKISRKEAPQPPRRSSRLKALHGDMGLVEVQPPPAHPLRLEATWPAPAVPQPREESQPTIPHVPIHDERDYRPQLHRRLVARTDAATSRSAGSRSALTFDQRPFFIAARYKYLLLLPFVLILSAALLMSVMSRSRQYQSVSRVLVQSTRFEQADPNSGCNPYVSLAVCIAGSMNMLLATDQFASEVAAEAGLPVETEADRAKAIEIVRRGTSVLAASDGLVVIWHTSDEAAEAQRLNAALVATYDKRYIEIVRRDGERATRFYETQLESDRRAQAEATTAFARWRESAPASGIATDPEYARLQGELQAANRQVQETEDRLDEIKAFVASVEQNRQDAFDVVDPATPGIAVTTKLTKLLVFPLAGFLLALSIAAALFTFLMKTDRRVRVADDLAVIPGLAVLGTVPDMSHEKRLHWPADFFRLAVTTLGIPERPMRERNDMAGTSE